MKWLPFLYTTLLFLFSFILLASCMYVKDLRDDDKLPKNYLVAYYSFDGASLEKDVSGNGHDATISGDPSLGLGKYGNGCEFDGNDDLFVNELNGSDFPEKGTVAVWVYGGYTAGTSRGILGMWDNTRTHVFIRTLSITRNIQVALETTTTYSLLHEEPPPGAAEWMHVAVTWDGDKNEGYVYINGSEAEHDTDISNFVPIDQIVRFGWDFDSNIDEVRIYNRVLSESEIQAIM